jgi:hypothetical protein
MSLVFLFLITIISTLGLAQTVPLMAVTRSSSLVRPLDAPPAGLVKLYSNLGSKTDAYDDNLGWIVWGPATGIQQWMAMPFTPKADATVKQIRIAIGNEGGTNSVSLNFTADAGGIPGKVLYRWRVKNLFPWGGCCSLDTARGAAIKVKKGTKYWIVGKTDSSNPDAMDVWAYSWNHAMGDISYNLGKGWKPYPNQVVAAFAVFGTKP